MGKRSYIKKTAEIEIYIDSKFPGIIFKQYSSEFIRELERERKKLIAIQKDENWPGFMFKPQIVSKIRSGSFRAGYPFLANGMTLKEYLKSNEISITTCARFINNLESDVLGAEDYIFPDLANSKNIMIIPSPTPMQNYKCIDPDDVLFGEYRRINRGALGISLSLLKNDAYAAGLEKCIEGIIPNKQMDIRSIFALLYIIFNPKESFYPCLWQKNFEDYKAFLRNLNIPVESELYQKSLQTLSDTQPNEPIGNALFELAEQGYEFDKQDNRYCLKKNRWYL